MSVRDTTHVVIVGAGFAGMACARHLSHADDVRVTLVDQNRYHQFQPLLYQVATAELTPKDVQFDLARTFHRAGNVTFQSGEAVSCDPRSHSVRLADGETVTGDVLVLATGAQPDFFRTPGAEEFSFPLYSVIDAGRVRGQLLQLLHDAATKPELIDDGALTFVIVGGGPTGVETAGALCDLINDVVPHHYSQQLAAAATVILVDAGQALLTGFSDQAHDYARVQLRQRGVDIRMATRASEVNARQLTLGDGSVVATHLVIWAGGEKATDLAGRSGISPGHGGRLDVRPDLTVDGFPGVYAVGDIANIPYGDESALPQLASVAEQSGSWAAKNIQADIRAAAANDHSGRQPFDFHDRGIMAMIGRKAAIAEIGRHRHEMHGRIAFAAWLGVHAQLLASAGAEVNAFLSWAEEFYLSPHHRSAELLDPAKVDQPRIAWSREG